MELFEIATREKYRFPFRGQISVEDLWDLSMKDLDAVFKTLKKEAGVSNEESLLVVKKQEDSDLSRKIAIVKRIFEIKNTEIEAAKLAKERADQRQKIMEVIASKKDAELQGKSLAELQAMLESM